MIAGRDRLFHGQAPGEVEDGASERRDGHSVDGRQVLRPYRCSVDVDHRTPPTTAAAIAVTCTRATAVVQVGSPWRTAADAWLMMAPSSS